LVSSRLDIDVAVMRRSQRMCSGRMANSSSLLTRTDKGVLHGPRNGGGMEIRCGIRRSGSLELGRLFVQKTFFFSRSSIEFQRRCYMTTIVITAVSRELRLRPDHRDGHATNRITPAWSGLPGYLHIHAFIYDPVLVVYLW
jgi:hypothetical protein